MIDIFVLPSRNEGLPISLLEAMAAKCAVVVTNVGEVKAVIIRPDYGALVQPGDAEAFALGIASYLTNTERLESCKERGYERVKESFSAQEMTREYCDIYTRVVGALIEKSGHNFNV
jgi:glycosyltransferase involved in cell wall biosynthesis